MKADDHVIALVRHIFSKNDYLLLSYT